jgi:hypothetical protein
MGRVLFHVRTANPVIALLFSICVALVSLISLLPIDLVDIAVMDLNGPVCGPVVPGQFFGECDTAVLSAFTKTADDKLNGDLIHELGAMFLGDLGGISVSFWTYLMVCKPPI